MKFETEFAGKKLIVTTGELAGQANGACTVQYGETVVLSTATMGTEDRDADFFPLTVEYEEKFYAAGKIKGSRFIKRETKPTDEAILTGRLIDRSIRPLFNQEMRRDVQIINTVLSVDQENSPDMVALYASVIALSISDIPWSGPITGMRGLDEQKNFIVNPKSAVQKTNALDLIVAGRPDQVVMVEAGAQEIDEETMFKAMKFASDNFAPLIKFFNEIAAKIGKQKDRDLLEQLSRPKEDYKTLAENFIRDNSSKYLFNQPIQFKADRLAAKEGLKKALEEFLATQGVEAETIVKAENYIYSLIYNEVSRAILESGRRIDGRTLDDIRPISVRAGVLPRVHGSALFARGETQVLSIVTLGSPGMEQYLDTMEESGTKRFMHHYNFPPFSVGETGSMRSTGRRETGHGALAERGLFPMIPKEDAFAYTIRVVSEVMSSNGSSSMASSCASCVALMDAGVPMKKPAAGIAIGLTSEVKDQKIIKYKTFTDLQDLEDGPGGMDFKVIGTRDGITAIQMDTKTPGLNFDIVREALDRAKKGRLQILEMIAEVLPAPRATVSTFAPKLISFKINPDKIREVVGPGGRVINDIIAKTGATIDIEQDGSVAITAETLDSLKKAEEMVKNIVREIQVGEVFEGKVTRLMDFGAFVELIPGHEGMVHVSEMSPQHVEHPSDFLKEGDVVPVKVIEIDSMGRINLSIRAAKEPDYTPRPKPARKPMGRGGFGGRGHGGRDGGGRCGSRLPRY